MKKSAFTIIELIFVIVIIGVLAAFALPQLSGTVKEGKNSQINSWIGTLKTTVSPILWNKSLNDGKNGDVTYLKLKDYVDIPDFIKDVNLSKCDDTDNYKKIGTANNGEEDINIMCKNGTKSIEPKFKTENNNSN